jgi:hypothetical protein
VNLQRFLFEALEGVPKGVSEMYQHKQVILWVSQPETSKTFLLPLSVTVHYS